MAKTVTTIRSCDIDGTTDEVVEVRFGYRGRGYTIDLCPEHFSGFRLYVDNATRAVGDLPGPKRKAETDGD